MINPAKFLAIATCIGFGVILSQSQSNTREAFQLTCNVDILISTQAELTTMLENFADDIEGESEVALSQLYEVGRTYQELALDCGHIPDDVGKLFIKDDVERILVTLEKLSGDLQQGQLLYNNLETAADGHVLGCINCHNIEETAPLTAGTWTRWDEIRRLQDGLEDYSFERYMVESIVLPWDYLVPEYGEGMPNNFGGRLSYQNLVDIIAYLSSQDQFLE